MSDGAFPDRLTQLRNRWESDPSSRVFLQLAEEYRHQGRVKEALDVLDRGLKEHPGYLSALVAKGRCHLELSEPDPARTVLERVVKQDATQMVANKLLVRAYLETGEPDRARERLDLYSLLNDSDPEIEDLRRRLRAMEQPPQARTPDPFQASDSLFPQAAPPAPAKPPLSGGDIFDLDLPAPRRPSADVFELDAPVPVAAPPQVPVAARAEDPFASLMPLPAAPASVVATMAEPAPAPVALAPEPEEEPEDVVFPGLVSRDSRRRYLNNLGSEGIFLLDLTPEAPSLAPEVFEEPAPVFDFEDRTPWTPEPEPFVAPVVSEAVEAPEIFAAPATPETAEVIEPEPAPASVATATLGDIYLSQGHLGEADRIYHEVLRREPENDDARLGLERLAVRRAEKRPLSGRDLLAGYEPGEEGGKTELRARKTWILTEYLRRLRGRSQRDVS